MNKAVIILLLSLLLQGTIKAQTDTALSLQEVMVTAPEQNKIH